LRSWGSIRRKTDSLCIVLDLSLSCLSWMIRSNWLVKSTSPARVLSMPQKGRKYDAGYRHRIPPEMRRIRKPGTGRANAPIWQGTEGLPQGSLHAGLRQASLPWGFQMFALREREKVLDISPPIYSSTIVGFVMLE
jgi:hypothetical protein